MAVSVVIPALNEARRIRRAVNSAWRAGAAEVIVVDGGSSDLTANTARDCGAFVLECDPGRANQQNYGARTAMADVVLFQHADCWLGPRAIGQIHRVWQRRPGKLVGAFRQRIAGVGPKYRLLEAGNLWRARVWGVPYGDQGIFFGRTFLRELGYFPDVPLMEDLLLMKRVRQQSWPTILEGPLHVDPRRWQKNGALRQTATNLLLATASQLGVSPQKLANFYPRHEEPDVVPDGLPLEAEEELAEEVAVRSSEDDRSHTNAVIEFQVSDVERILGRS